MRSKGLITILALALMVMGWCEVGWAKDAVQAAVVAAPGATIEENGNPYSAGTYAVGTIRLIYTEAGSVWNSGDFADFTMGIQIKEGSGSPATSYPVTLNFRQTGSSNLLLTVTNCSDLTDASWDGSESNLTLQSSNAMAHCNVNVSVGDIDPALNYDGSVLVGNLQMETPGGAHLDTVTSIQVKIMLVDPTTCLRLFNVITDFDSATEVNNLGIKAKNNGTIQNTSPNNLADAVYLVNTCSTDFYADLLLTLDPHFAPASASQGHSVFFFTSESFDPDIETLGEALSDGDFVDFGSTQGSQSTCLGNQKITANSTLLIKVKNRLATGNVSGLPPVSHEFTGFSSAVYYPESGCSGSLDPDADPNPIDLSLPFSVN